MDFCRSRGILITAYSPLGSSDRPWAKPEDPQLSDDVKLRQIAKKYSKTPTQIVLRYQVQRGNITIVRSLTPSKIEENIRIFDSELSSEDMRYIDGFDCNGRTCRFERCVKIAQKEETTLQYFLVSALWTIFTIRFTMTIECLQKD